MPIEQEEYEKGNELVKKKHVTEIMEEGLAYSIPEIASLLDIHIASARQRLQRAEMKGLVEPRMVKGKTYWALTIKGVKYGNDVRYSN